MVGRRYRAAASVRSDMDARGEGTWREGNDVGDGSSLVYVDVKPYQGFVHPHREPRGKPPGNFSAVKPRERHRHTAYTEQPGYGIVWLRHGDTPTGLLQRPPKVLRLLPSQPPLLDQPLHQVPKRWRDVGICHDCPRIEVDFVA